MPAILVCASLRLIYWIQVSDEAWFLAPGTDPEFYRAWADAIIGGAVSEYLPFPRAPLYAYLLAAVRAACGDFWLWSRMLNLAADIFTTIAVFKIAEHIKNRSAGFAASLVYAAAGAGIYFSGEMLMTSLATALISGYILVTLRLQEGPNPAGAATSGILLGLASLFRPNALLLFPLAIFAIFKGKKDSDRYFRSVKLTFYHAAAILLIIAPVIAVNWQSSGRLIPISIQGGVNFFIGNARNASGWSSSLPGVGAAWVDGDARRVASSNAGKQLSDPETSAELWRMGLDEIWADPGSWFMLMLKKTLLLFNIREIGNNRPLSLAVKAAPMMEYLFLLSAGMLMPFALLALWQQRKDRRYRLLIAFILVYGISIIIFFVNSRYRMPLLPVFAVLAVCGAGILLDSFKTGKTLVRVLPVVLTGILIAVPNWFGDTFEQPAQVEYVSGNAYLRLGKMAEALERYRAAEKHDPAFPELQLNIGVALLSLGDTVQAARAFEAENLQYPENSRALNNLGVIAEHYGELDEAAERLKLALAVDSSFEDARSNLFRIYLKKGDMVFKIGHLGAAFEEYVKASVLYPSAAQPWHRMALVSLSNNDRRAARDYAEEALQRDPKYEQARSLIRVLDSMD